LIANYLFNDIFRHFPRFFGEIDLEDSASTKTTLLSELAYGFQPRVFFANDEDRMIYDENQEVAELYFIQEGFIGVGFSQLSSGSKQTISKR
jgi:hypothetical protein